MVVFTIRTPFVVVLKSGRPYNQDTFHGPSVSTISQLSLSPRVRWPTYRSRLGSRTQAFRATSSSASPCRDSGTQRSSTRVLWTLTWRYCPGETRLRSGRRFIHTHLALEPTHSIFCQCGLPSGTGLHLHLAKPLWTTIQPLTYIYFHI